MRPGPRHIGYTLHVEMRADGRFGAILAYTTTSGLDFPGRMPAGVLAFTAAAAEALGQRKPFRLDLRRLAWLPVTPAWFPDLATPTRGVTGRAPRDLRRDIQAAFDAMARRQPELLTRLGPLWGAD